MTFELPSPWPRVTVNILSYNRRDLVRETLLKTLGELDYPRDRLEIVLVDNESSDGTKEMVAREFPDVRVIVIAKNIGVTGWNKGFEAGTGDYFLVLDDDCFLTGDALKQAVRGAQEQGADLVSFVVRSGYDPTFVFNTAFNTGLMEFWGCSVLISRRAIEQLKGFDPNIRFLAHELEFSIRFFDRGFKHLFLPEVGSLHMKKAPANPRRAHSSMMKAQRRSLGFIAAKLLQPRDAAAALVNIFVKTFIIAAKNPLAILSLPDLMAGVRSGLKHRAPVRAEISTIYRRNFIEFVSPLRFVGRGSKRRRFFKNRPRFYPGRKATLQL